MLYCNCGTNNFLVEFLGFIEVHDGYIDQFLNVLVGDYIIGGGLGKTKMLKHVIRGGIYGSHGQPFTVFYVAN